MKKTIKISIGGYACFIDEDAFYKLDNYLKKIKNHLSPIEGGAEVYDDIENRIAEHFNNITNKIKEVITIDEVNQVIQLIGKPQDFSEMGQPENKNYANYAITRSNVNFGKKLYRDPDNRVFGGVCSGIAAYFALDPVIVRIIFAISCAVIGIGPIIYIILWIVLPAAYTSIERMEMKGERINLSNIEYTLRKEFNEVKQSWTGK